VKPETADFLNKARHCLSSAETIAAAGVADVAAREAYLAAFHAAEAYIFERTGKAAKTHRGVRGQFSRLAQEASIEREFLTFLAKGYELKTSPIMGSVLRLTRFHRTTRPRPSTRPCALSMPSPGCS
jgi:uncharacterized protein (UPF0332 family)